MFFVVRFPLKIKNSFGCNILNFRGAKNDCFGKKLYMCNRIGKMQEWLNWHAWKACKRLKRFGGSNPPLSAKQGATGNCSSFFWYMDTNKRLDVL